MRSGLDQSQGYHAHTNETGGAPVIVDPTRVCQVLVGLPDVRVLGVDDVRGGVLVVHIEQSGDRPACLGCGATATVKDREVVLLADLPCFGRKTRLAWHKVRLRCGFPDCAMKSWTWIDHRIAAPRLSLTDRAGRWATLQVGLGGRSVSEVARDLGCDWHTVNDAVIAYGTPLVDDPGRFATVLAVGLDETLFCRRGPRHRKEFCTSIVDVGAETVQLLDVVPGREAKAPTEWLLSRSAAWRQCVIFGALDLSGPYRKGFLDALSHVVLVADPFHVVKVANSKLDECRRRVQNELLGHRGRKDDPLYRARRLLTKAHERLDERGEQKLQGLLEAGDPHGEVRMAWHAKEVVRSIYEITDAALARQFVTELGADLQDRSCPPEVNSLGRTLTRWLEEIVAWHGTGISNGPTEGANNLIERIKRIGFGLRNFATYRIRVLLYAGRPRWELLARSDPAKTRRAGTAGPLASDRRVASCHRTFSGNGAVDAWTDSIAPGRTCSTGFPAGSSSSQSRYLFPGYTGQVSPQPMVTMTSAPRAVFSVRGFGNSRAMSSPRSFRISTTDGFSCSAGSDPADSTTTRPSA
jgi:transposase